MRRWALFGAVLLAGCGASTPAGTDAGSSAIDAGPIDAGASDAGFDAGPVDAGPCGADMAYVLYDGGAVCVDRFEAALLVKLPDGGEAGWPYYDQIDGLDAGVRAIPADGIKPQAYISGVQSASACAASGKRLCKLDEWLGACRGPSDFIYPYGDAFIDGGCNVGRSTNPIIDLFGTFNVTYADFNDPRLDQLPDTVAPGGAFEQCVSAWGVYDLHGNVHEWIDETTSTGHGVFKGGFFVDGSINGPGCLYTTTAHAPTYHDYSTGFRCCSDPAW